CFRTKCDRRKIWRRQAHVWAGPYFSMPSEYKRDGYFDQFPHDEHRKDPPGFFFHFFAYFPCDIFEIKYSYLQYLSYSILLLFLLFYNVNFRKKKFLFTLSELFKSVIIVIH